MKRILNVLKGDNIGVGYLYFYVHFITEVVCFFLLSRVLGNSVIVYIIPFMYDMFAFVPQSLIGYLSDKYPKINMGIIGTFLLILGFILFFNTSLIYLSVIILCLGNGCLHVSGAEETLRTSKGHLASSAIFVGGGSFGVITGKLLASTTISPWFIALIALSMIPFILLASTYKKDNIPLSFDYHNKSINPSLVVFLAVFIVIVRGYMGYGIPTSWNKTVIQTVLLFVSMGFGKCLGGILVDAFGMRKVALSTVILAIPFLLFGDNIMLLSLIGVIMFSMTMSITLGLLVSVLNKTPGLAFGLTTIGLFLGTTPIFFIKLTTFSANATVILVFSILCYVILKYIIRKD